MNGESWDAIAAIFTATASIIALAGLWFANRSAREQIGESKRQFTAQLAESERQFTEQLAESERQATAQLDQSKAEATRQIEVSERQFNQQMAQDREHLDRQVAAQEAALRREVDDRAAEPVRLQLAELAFRSQRIARVVSDGAAIISVLRHTGEAIVRAAGPGDPAAGGRRQAVRDFVLGPPGGQGVSFLPFAMGGWEESPAGRQLLEDTDVVVSIGTTLEGDLLVMQPGIDMIETVVNDLRMLIVNVADDQVSGPPFRRALLESFLEGADDNDISVGLSAALYGNLSAYIVANQYPALLGAVASLIADATAAFATLDGGALREARRPATIPATTSPTDEIDERLQTLATRSTLDTAVQVRLRGWLDAIEDALAASATASAT